MSIIDIGIIFILLMFIIVGFKNGVIREVVSIIGIIVILYISFALKGVIGNMLCIAFPFFEFSGNIKGISMINVLLYQGIAFLLVFTILLSLYALLIKLSRTLQKLINMTIILWLPSKLLGAVVGFIKGYIILFACFMILMIPLGNMKSFSEDKFVNKIIYETPVLSDTASTYTKSIEEVFDLGLKVSRKEISADEANLETLDLMLKHKMVDKNTIIKLQNKNKLHVKNINSVLKKY